MTYFSYPQMEYKMFINFLNNAKSRMLLVFGNEEGQDLAEFALVLVFISIMTMAAASALGISVADIINRLALSLSV